MCIWKQVLRSQRRSKISGREVTHFRHGSEEQQGKMLKLRYQKPEDQIPLHCLMHIKKRIRGLKRDTGMFWYTMDR